MANLNYNGFLGYFRKQIDKNPFIVKAILIHVGIVAVLYVLSYISLLKFDSTVRLQAEVAKVSKQMQVIQATSITSNELENQVNTYEQHQQKLRQIEEGVKKAKEQAIIKAKEEAKRKAEAEKLRVEQEEKAKIEAQKKVKEEAKRKAEAERHKLEQEKKAKLEAEAKKAAELKARKERLAKAEAAAKKQIEQNQAQSAIVSYISEYKDRIGANWIKDPCRGIDSLPDAIIRNGQFIKLTGTSGDYRCDTSMIDAIKNTTPPIISNNVARKTILAENVRFEFEF
ncbi:cell envelope integrity protein TolA [Allofrancisella guangzhouensis]|uniref:Gramicidin synthase n=1 Tax=Allofrancisella guangzhouensis TaxID=594679 RepID=A0A0A8E3K6_9GAMM|nr:cell envelope integrity protein TolA [Allofrancisella guangzhouensis]AJC48192.1 gramicidin synthase [Allofrancisella guangzhouensis]MBK2027058.1 cell envelope integrity protein TolA [Allofrancisella guangzhouensis]MBK2044548.1 cell envelope integrity protein TolA [Allofrancisella guangzhouensis]MBK2046120.1 cell envelope integrity protein TolA [Allofrancisella guangzhouensis]